MNKNIFLDLGTHHCQGLTQFVSNILPIDKTWEIHSFEPNPLIDVDLHYKNNNFLQSKGLNVTFHRKAVWVEEGEFTFKMYGHDGCSLGSLLKKTKGDGLYKDYYSSSVVECIDFWNFINTKFKAPDNIYIKMDVEWAEYFLLQDMLERGWPQNIVKMWIEFHGMHDTSYVSKAGELIKQIQSNYSTEIVLWH